MTNQNDIDASGIKWNLTEYFDDIDTPKYNSALTELQECSENFAAKWRSYFDDLSNFSLSAGELVNLLVDVEDIEAKAYRIQAFVHCKSTAHTEDMKYQGELAKLSEIWSRCWNRMMFYELGLKKLPESKLQEYLSSDEFSNYNYYLDQSTKNKKFALSEPEEKWISLKGVTGKGAWVRFFDQIVSTFRFSVPTHSDKELSEEEVRTLREDPRREVREQAVKALSAKYRENSKVLTPVFNNIFKDHLLECEERGYVNAMDSVNRGNDLSEKAVNALLDTTEENYSLMQRYYALKAKALGIPAPMEAWDVMAPFKKEETKIPFSEARKTIIDAYDEFDKELGEMVTMFFDKNYIEAENRKAKRGGAYCISFGKGGHPRVFMTYTGGPSDVSTIAHEFGHAIHAVLADTQTQFYNHAVLPMAETASVFGEMLLTKKMLRKIEDESDRQTLLGRKIEDMFATIFRQNGFIRFEQRAYQERAKAELKTEDFSKIWKEETIKQFGNSVKYLEDSQYTWQGIPHFVHSRFYCYSYTFGELLSLALYDVFEKNPTDEFKENFKTLLKGGSSKSPQDLLSPFGINLESKDFWQSGFKMIESFIDEFEKTLN